MQDKAALKARFYHQLLDYNHHGNNISDMMIHLFILIYLFFLSFIKSY